jgi:prolipoprotein diacylglyceryltransferase
MHQILFHVPFTEGWLTPQGVPVAAYGMTLFVAFFLVTWWAGRRTAKVGLSRERTQDLSILLFLCGIAGARVLYMWQYADEMGLKRMSVPEVVGEFFKIWNGGIVVYGAVGGGLLAYIVYRQRVLKRLGINGWQLADAIAPMLAVGMAIGRIGCYLNGCCWGQVACEACQPVPLSADLGRFPLLPAHARKQVCLPPGEKARLPQIHGLQTTAGFAIRPPDRAGAADPRAVIAAVEPGSEAERAGLRPGDRVVGVNGGPNRILLELTGQADVVGEAVKKAGGEVVSDATSADGTGRSADVGFETPDAALKAKAALQGLAANGLAVGTTDTLNSLLRMSDGAAWPRGRNTLDLVVDRGGQTAEVSLVPRTVTFFPTQLYETVSMVLLTGLLLAFQPFRRHDGQVMVLLMVGYAAHRFLNEAIRIEPTYALGLTLSQWVSVGIFAAAVALELYLRRTQPKLPPGEVPLGYGATPAAA